MYSLPDLQPFLKDVKDDSKPASIEDLHKFVFFCMNHLPHYPRDYLSDQLDINHCSHFIIQQIADKIFQQIDWNDLINGNHDIITYTRSKKTESAESKYYKQNESVSTDKRGCQIFFGSIATMPYIQTCLFEKTSMNISIHPISNSTRNLEHAYCHDDLHLVSRAPCISTSHTTRMVIHYKVTWSMAKFNYGLVLSTTAFILLPSTYQRFRQHQGNIQPTVLFGPFNVIWMMWRLQDTLHWETNWQRHVPYVCIAMNTVRYLVEGMSLFLFAWTSVERYQALAGSLTKLISNKNMKMFIVAVAVGATTGALCSVLHIIALFMMADPAVLKTCVVPRDKAANLLPLIAVKVVSLLAMYAVPCIVMSAANIAMSKIVSKKVKQTLGRCHSKNQRARGKKTKVISGFLVFSSIFMVCCVSKPVFEVYIALRIHVGIFSQDRDTVGMLLDAISWNLTTIAYVINTVLGIRYTK